MNFFLKVIAMNLAQFARLSALEEFLFEQLAHLYAYVSIRQNTSAYATLLAQLVRLSALEEFLFEQLAHLYVYIYIYIYILYYMYGAA